MKSTKHPVKKLESSYPMMKEDKYGLVVLFSSERVGTVIYVPSATFCYRLGYYSTTWFKEDFKEFHGQLIMEN
ncbi:MAG: hypothetical protein KGI08_04605 [Thaumarchaeota archaeon]|nr:hypothetical protein [Nitrososphaerota archaeon]